MREIDKLIEGMQRAWKDRVDAQADGEKPTEERAEPEMPVEAEEEEAPPIDAGRLLRERLRRKPKQRPVPGARDRGIRNGETETR